MKRNRIATLEKEIEIYKATIDLLKDALKEYNSRTDAALKFFILAMKELDRKD